MRKNKIKLSLVDDYIKIIIIKNFFNNQIENISTNCFDLLKSTQNLDIMLEKIFENLFEQLKMNDSSLALLKKELKENNSLFLTLKRNNFSDLEKTLKTSNNLLINIMENLKKKTQSLRLKCEF